MKNTTEEKNRKIYLSENIDNLNVDLDNINIDDIDSDDIFALGVIPTSDFGYDFNALRKHCKERGVEPQELALDELEKFSIY